MANKWEIIDERELDRAEALIWEGRYEEARQLLTKLNNDPARELLAQLPQAAQPEAKTKIKYAPTKQGGNLQGANQSLIGILLLMLVMLFLCVGIANMSRISSGRYQATPRPYQTTNPSIILFNCMESANYESCFARSFAYDQCRGQGHDANYCWHQINYAYPIEP